MLFNYWGLLDKNHFFALTYRIFKVHWITWDKLTFKVQTKRALFYFGNILVTVNTEAYEQIYMRTLALQLFGNINVMQNSPLLPGATKLPPGLGKPSFFPLLWCHFG
jgi:hypothetical protein